MKHSAVLKAALLAAALVSGSARADVIGYLSNVVGPTDTEVTYTLTMPKFNPALGTLTSVKIYFYASEQVTSLTLTNTGSTVQSFGALATANLVSGMSNTATAADRYSAVQQTLVYFDTGIGTAIGNCTDNGPVVKPNQCTQLTYSPGESHNYASPAFTFANTDSLYLNDSNNILTKGTGVLGLVGLVRNGTSISNYVGTGNWSLTGTTLNTLTLNGAGGNISFAQMTKGTFRAEVDYTYTPAPPSGAIGDLVWDDVNGNGVQDSGEPGISGVTVRLKQNSTVLQSTTTGSNGAYSFTGLAAGTYTVEVDAATLPAGYTASPALQGGDSAKDSNGSPATVTLAPAETNLTIDFGYYKPGKIGDFVWQDTNHNGKQDDGDTGINGVRVDLCADSGCPTLLANTVTGTSPNGKPGYYQFSNLAPGTYYVRIPSGQSVLASLIPTFLGQGTSVEDSNPNPSATVLTFAAPSDQTIDFGFTPPGDARIGDLVWSDSNHNGVQDAGEPGIGGVKLKLGRNSDCSNLEAVTTSAPDGSYLFQGLFGGTYYVCVDASTVPANYTATAVNIGSADTDSNNHSSAPVTVADHGSDLTIDFGYVPPAVGTIGDFVWRDVNRNGMQEAGEPGINGVKIQLYDSQNQLIRTTYTANANGTDGYYQFTGLQADTYRVEVDASTLPAGYFATTSNTGGAAVDSNGSPAGVTLVTNSSNDATIDFGYQSPCTGGIGDLVWNDANANGVQDAGELGIPGVTVTLRAADNSFIASTTTDANGRYSFGGLCAASYRVEVATPPGYTASVSNAGGDLAKDSNGSPAVVTLPADATDDTIDFGYNIPSNGGALTTFTQGGWGSKPNGNNPGMLLKNNFNTVFPSGVTIGGGKTLKFTSQTAVQNFLPAGGKAAALTASAVDPTKSSAGVFAGQVLALQLSVSFSNAGITKPGLAGKKVKSGAMAGYTVADVLAMANAALGGAATPVSINDLNTVVDAINNNYDNGTTDKGYLQ